MWIVDFFIQVVTYWDWDFFKFLIHQRLKNIREHYMLIVPTKFLKIVYLCLDMPHLMIIYYEYMMRTKTYKLHGSWCHISSTFTCHYVVIRSPLVLRSLYIQLWTFPFNTYHCVDHQSILVGKLLVCFVTVCFLLTNNSVWPTDI